MSPETHGRTGFIVRWVRAVCSLLALIAVVVGLPALLVLMAPGLHLDTAALSPQALLRPDNGNLLLLTIYALAWLFWVMFAVSTAIETRAALRGLPAPRLRPMGPVQHLAAALVASVTLVLPTASHASTAAAVEAPAMSLPVAQSVEQAPTASALSANQRVKSPTLPEVTVRRHDSLWLLAEQYLGRGERYTEILELNRGVGQHDGHALGRDGDLRPGWVLKLPADARMDSPRPDRWEVEPGDTLWEIAKEELGDPTRYPEIYRENKGDTQPGGGHLTDPDLIYPGWIMEIPQPADVGKAEGKNPKGSKPNLEYHPQPALPVMPESQPPIEPESTPAPSFESSLPDPSPASSVASVPPAAAPAPPTISSVPSDVASRSDGLSIVLPAGGIIGGLLGAGLFVELARRRHNFQRWRGIGEHLRPISQTAEAVEAAAIGGGLRTQAELLNQALTQLAHNCWQQRRPLPDLRIAKLGRADLTLHLHQPDADAVAPFVTVDGRRWELDPSALEDLLPDHPRAYPSLITLGIDGDQIILLNLESVGTLAITGTDTRVREVLRGLSAELAFGPVRLGASRTLCLRDDRLAEAMEPGELVTSRDPDRVARAVGLHIEVLATTCDREGVTNTRELITEDPYAITPPEIVLSDQPLTISPHPWSGAALITTASGTPGATLVLDEEGGAILEPGRIWMVPQAIKAEEFDAIIESLHSADLDPLGEPSVESQMQLLLAGAAPDVLVDLRERRARREALTGGYDTELAPAALGLWDAVARTSARDGEGQLDLDLLSTGALALAVHPDPADQHTEGAAPRLLLLGELQIENAQGKASPSRSSRLAEVAAYIHLHPNCRISDLQAALWPGQISNPNTCRQLISRTRSLLGKDENGKPFLLLQTETSGRLRLSDQVTSDWDDFQKLTGAGGISADHRAKSLRRAMQLIRGRPFGPVTGRPIDWADLALNHMIDLITSAAHELYELESAAGRYFEARDAALRGLLTDAEFVTLLEDAIEASVAIGDHAATDGLRMRLAGAHADL